MDEQEELYYLEDVMVASSGSGFKYAGDKVDVVDVADSLAWLKELHKVGTREEAQLMLPEFATEVVEVPPVVVDETTEPEVTETAVDANSAELIEKAKECLAKGKKRLADLATDVNVTEAVLKPVLTKENGFLLNQQGWYSVQVSNNTVAQ